MGLWGILNDQNIALQGPNSAKNAIGIHTYQMFLAQYNMETMTGYKIVEFIVFRIYEVFLNLLEKVCQWPTATVSISISILLFRGRDPL